jgi:hypothetical protein
VAWACRWVWGQDCPAIDRICRAGGEGAKSECRASLREGLEETLTVLRLGVPPTLARSLCSTTCVENMIGICRDHSRNVKRWRNGQMALRWCAAGMVEATAQFRRVNGHLHLRTLRAALERHVAPKMSARQATMTP